MRYPVLSCIIQNNIKLCQLLSLIHIITPTYLH
jgi:hypothetical protein